jgi:hypothetical protein
VLDEPSSCRGTSPCTTSSTESLRLCGWTSMGSMSSDVLLRSFFVVPRDVAGRDVIGGVFRCVARRRRANVAGLDVICGVSYTVCRGMPPGATSLAEFFVVP